MLIHFRPPLMLSGPEQSMDGPASGSTLRQSDRRRHGSPVSKVKVDRLLIILGEAPLKPDPLVMDGQRLEWNRNLVIDWLIVGTFLAGLGR